MKPSDFLRAALNLSEKRVRNERAILMASGLFDPEYYLKSNPDIAQAGIDPVDHYLNAGWREGRQPSAAFDAAAYLSANPDIATAGVNPLLHWIEHGEAEHRPRSAADQDPWQRERALITNSGLFDTEHYLTASLEASQAKLDPLEHYLAVGWRKGLQPSAEFDASAYLHANPDVAAARLNPLLHWIEFGQREGRPLPPCPLPRDRRAAALQKVQQSGFFDADFYLKQVPWLERAAIDPALHYLLHGYKNFLEPSPRLSMQAYLAGCPSLKTNRGNPLLDFIDQGAPMPSAVADARKRWSPAPGTYALPTDICRNAIMAGVALRSRFEAAAPGDADVFLKEIAGLKTCDPRLDKTKGPLIVLLLPRSAPLDQLINCLASVARHEAHATLEVVMIKEALPSHVSVHGFSAIDWINIVSADEGDLDDWLEQRRPDFILVIDRALVLVQDFIDRIIGSFALSQSVEAVIPRQLKARVPSPPNDPSVVAHDEENAPDRCYARLTSVETPMPCIALRAGAWRRYQFVCQSNDGAPSARSSRAKGGVPLITALYQPMAMLIAFPPVLAADQAGVLNSREPEASQVSEDPIARPRLLVLDALTPTPDSDSGSLITFKMLEAFRQLDFEISFFATHSHAWDEVYAANLQANGIRCLYEPYITNLEQIVRSSGFDYVLAYRVSVIHPHFDVIRRHAPLARIIFHNVDLHYLRLQREAALTQSIAARIEAARLQTMEMEMFVRADCSIVHTAVEKALVTTQAPLRTIVEFPYIADVKRSRSQLESRHDVMFLGGFAHAPNIDAVQFFVSHVWPALIANLPSDAKFLIVGASPPPAIQELANERIVVTGKVEDLEPWFDRARVFVAPLRYGAGIKGKVIQSLAHGVPSVVTSIAAEGVGLIDGRHAIVADAPDAICAAVIELFHDKRKWGAMQEAGYGFVEEHFSWERCLEICRAVLSCANETWIRREEGRRKQRLRLLLELEGEHDSEFKTAH